MAKEIRTIGVLTSGGDAQGMNPCIRAVVRRALNKGLRVKGIRKGYNGLLNNDIFDMEARDVADIIHRGGTILYTARCTKFYEEEYQIKAAETARMHGIDGLVVIGGDGSFRGAQKLSKQGINVVGIPGTIDLDIPCSDYTIGFDTAVNIALDAIVRLRDTSASHERCSVIEVMGRRCGELALWAGLGGGADVIMIPEDPDSANFDHVLSVIRANRARGKNHNIIVVAEGMVADGYIEGSQKLAQKIQEVTGIESRATVLGHVQRGGSPTCLDVKHASMMGAYAVDLLCQGATDRVVAYKGNQYVDFDIDEALEMKRPPSLDILETNLSISIY